MTQDNRRAQQDDLLGMLFTQQKDKGMATQADSLKERLARLDDDEARALDRKQREQDAELDRIARERARVQRRILVLEEYGEDVWADGTVISFQKNFGANVGVRNSRTGSYEYVGIRAGGQWFITGAAHKDALSWDALVAFFSASPIVLPDDVWVVDAWTPMVDVPDA